MKSLEFLGYPKYSVDEDGNVFGHVRKHYLKPFLTNGYQAGLTLERINKDGNYEPSNCRWATWKEQSANKRRS